MFAKATNVGFAQRVVATLVACALLLWSIGAYSTAQAANLTFISDTLSDSDVNVVSDHTIVFTTPSGVAAGESIVITFPNEASDFDLSTIGAEDIDLASTSDYSVQNGAASGETWGVATTTFSITLTSQSAVIAPNATVTIEIGTNATFGGGSQTQIVNPAAFGGGGSYEIQVAAGTSDTGRTRVAIIDNVLVTAIVDTAFNFIIGNVATGTEVITGLATTTGFGGTTTLDFGNLVAGVPELLAQTLSVTTNSANGFVVTVKSDGNLESATTAIIDNFLEGSDIADTGTAWASPVPVITDDTSWGHWGLASNDDDLNSLGGFYSGEFGNTYIAASTTPREVFHHDGPSDGSTNDKGLVDVWYKIEITALQEAADDYSTTLTYVATPTF